MNIKLQKKEHNNFKKLIKVDSNNNLIDGEGEIYVRVEEIPSNLINNDATPLTETVFENINWKDNDMILFQLRNSLPEKIPGVIQVVALENGETWCIPGVDIEPYKLGSDDLQQYLKKNFQYYEAITLLGSITKLGALPVDFSETGNANVSTYLEVNDGSIAFKINGVQKHVFNNEKASLTHNNGEIVVNDNEIALKNHNNITTIGLKNGNLYIKGNNTLISEDLINNKLNSYTDLNNAVYGNNSIHLEFYPDLVRFKNANGGELLAIKTNGSIYANSTNRVIDSSTINNYISSYFNENFESKFRACYEQIKLEETAIFIGNDQLVPVNVLEENMIRIEFSEAENGEILSISFIGNNIDNLEKIYKAETTHSYLPEQHVASDDSDTDYVKIYIYDSSNVHIGFAYIKGIYRE